MGIAEDAEPVEFGFGDELLQKFKVAERLAGKADDEAGAERDAGDGGADLGERTRKMSAEAPRFMRFSTSGDACCSGRSRYLQMLSCFAMVSSSLPVMRLG